jgi:PIN domain nuclease of toxin-antitoxin system
VILLLDSHSLLWALAGPEELTGEARRAIEDPANDVLASVGSIWELEVKQALGKLRLGGDLLTDLEGTRFDILAIVGADAVAAARLRMHHRDPFDRMLVAQARRLEATIVSRDAVFDRYGVNRLAA